MLNGEISFTEKNGNKKWWMYLKQIENKQGEKVSVVNEKFSKDNKNLWNSMNSLVDAKKANC